MFFNWLEGSVCTMCAPGDPENLTSANMPGGVARNYPEFVIANVER
jgi:hypothetical protein